jgi:hypothetical protein
MDGSTRVDRLSRFACHGSFHSLLDRSAAFGRPAAGQGGRARSLRVLLFAHKVVQERAALMRRGGKPSFHRLSPVNDVRSVDHVGETDKTRFHGCG